MNRKEWPFLCFSLIGELAGETIRGQRPNVAYSIRGGMARQAQIGNGRESPQGGGPGLGAGFVLTLSHGIFLYFFMKKTFLS